MPSTLHTLFLLWLAFIGGCIGSFMNVVVYRLPLGKSLIYPGSQCPHCGHAIRWHDNIPVLGWLILNGQCRDCRAAISSRYPFVEALVAILFVLLAVKQPSPSFLQLPERATLTTEAWPQPLAWGVYALQLTALCVLLAGALMQWDRRSLPASLFVTPILLAVLATLVWPNLLPPVWPGMSADPISNLINLSASVAMMVAATVLVRRIGSLRAESATLGRVLLIVGVTLGWRMALMAVIIGALGYGLGKLTNPRAMRRWPWMAYIFVVCLAGLML